MTVPNGKPNLSGGYFNLNEYVVYNINQARIRYVLWMNLNGNGWMMLLLFLSSEMLIEDLITAQTVVIVEVCLSIFWLNYWLLRTILHFKVWTWLRNLYLLNYSNQVGWLEKIDKVVKVDDIFLVYKWEILIDSKKHALKFLTVSTTLRS